MKRIRLETNDIPSGEPPPKADERSPGNEPGIEIQAPDWPESRKNRSWFWLTGGIIVGFWIFQYVSITLRVYLSGMGDTPWVSLLVPRAIVSGVSLIVSFALPFLISRFRDSAMVRQAQVVILSSVIMTIVVSIANSTTFYFLVPGPESEWRWDGILTDFLWRIWTFFSVAMIILALSYASDIREREQRIHALQQLAHSAQLRALRNQLNPHFLFNALNSIAGLMRVKRPADAETMTENLADFLRTTLALDPQSMITLDEELRLQNLYLAIEKVRFPDRLRVEVTIPAALEGALVPSLVTQPLIENSIKYAVARSTEPVHLRIGAERSGNQLVLTIEDDGGNATAVAEKSSRLGLRNIAERLQVHFGGRASITAEPLGPGGYVNRVTLPLEFAR